MNEPPGAWIKYRTIKLRKSDIAGDINLALPRLAALPGIINMDHAAATLAVRYNLREICLADIQSELHSLNIQLELELFQKLRYDLIHFIESNQRKNLQQKSGWRERLQDIYVYYSLQKVDEADDIPSQL